MEALKELQIQIIRSGGDIGPSGYCECPQSLAELAWNVCEKLSIDMAFGGDSFLTGPHVKCGPDVANRRLHFFGRLGVARMMTKKNIKNQPDCRQSQGLAPKSREVLFNLWSTWKLRKLLRTYYLIWSAFTQRLVERLLCAGLWLGYQGDSGEQNQPGAGAALDFTGQAPTRV